MLSDRTKSAFKFVLTVGVLFLLVYFLRKNLRELEGYDFHVKIIYLIASSMLLLVALIILPGIWYFITQSLDCDLRFKQSLRIRLITEVGKYIPGRVLGYGYLIVHYKDAGKDQIKVLNSSIYELYLSTFSSFFFYTIIHLFTSFKMFNPFRIEFIIISILGILSLNPFFFQKMSDLICRLFKKERLVYKISYSRAIGTLLLYLGYWVIFSLAFFLFVKAFADIQFSNFLYISGSFAISAFAGFLAFFLPAGLGAREAVLIYMLGILTGNVTAIVISIGSRIWIITGDLILFCYALISTFINQRNKPNEVQLV
jgi:hypothetical protein